MGHTKGVLDPQCNCHCHHEGYDCNRCIGGKVAIYDESCPLCRDSTEAPHGG